MKLPPRTIEPLMWGFIGAVAVGAIAIVVKLSGGNFAVEQPVAGGFFTGWVFGLLWNWSGRDRR